MSADNGGYDAQHYDVDYAPRTETLTRVVEMTAAATQPLVSVTLNLRQQ